MNGSFIPLSIPHLEGNEWKYVKECVDTGWVSSVGSYVDRFEESVAGYVGTKHGVATVSGTAALHVSLMLAGVERDDEVIVSTLTFIAPVNAIRYIGAWPVFIDAEERGAQMDAAKVGDFIKSRCQVVHGELRNRETGRRVRAILPVHILGHMVDMTQIVDVAGRYKLPVVEDATECLGASFKGRRAGSIGDVACFSFNGNKIITTGGGGMIVTDNEAWARKAKYLTTQAKDDPVEFIHGEVGYNYRLTNIQAAIGCAQMEQLDGFIGRKLAIAETYMKELENVNGIKPIMPSKGVSSTWWMFTVKVDERTFGMDSRALLKKLEAMGIQTRPLWQPVHMSPAYASNFSEPYPVAERFNRVCLSLPCSVGLKEGDQVAVVEAVRSSSSSK